uniref:DUF1508 domain-containing protein n=1 Tax=Ascaris lumbricoides TaxID=6252 RepID=A0A0M3HQS7_ASCLU
MNWRLAVFEVEPGRRLYARWTLWRGESGGRERVGAKSASNYICIRNQRREAAACAGDLALESRTAD